MLARHAEHPTHDCPGPADTVQFSHAGTAGPDSLADWPALRLSKLVAASSTTSSACSTPIMGHGDSVLLAAAGAAGVLDSSVIADATRKGGKWCRSSGKERGAGSCARANVLSCASWAAS